jgi:hypothetical protein
MNFSFGFGKNYFKSAVADGDLVGNGWIGNECQIDITFWESQGFKRDTPINTKYLQTFDKCLAFLSISDFWAGIFRNSRSNHRSVAVNRWVTALGDLGVSIDLNKVNILDMFHITDCRRYLVLRF